MSLDIVFVCFVFCFLCVLVLLVLFVVFVFFVCVCVCVCCFDVVCVLICLSVFVYTIFRTAEGHERARSSLDNSWLRSTQFPRQSPASEHTGLGQIAA